MSRPSQLSRETRALRFGGIALVVLGLAALVPLTDRAEVRPDLLTQPLAWLRYVAPLVIAVNVFTIGCVLLLAGLRELSLRQSSRARRGAMTRVAAVNLLLGLGALDGLAPESDDDSALYLVAIVVFLLLARAAVTLFRTGWKYEAVTAEEALLRDRRAPVVYLRSFEVDDQILTTDTGWRGTVARFFMYTASVSAEQELAWIMDRVGPVVAIGKPGERLPELGAARLYVTDEAWRQTIGDLMNRAALTVVRAGNTANLWWEIEHALAHCAPERVLVVALGRAEQFTFFDRRFVEEFGQPVDVPLPARSRLAKWLMRLRAVRDRSVGKIIYFDRQRSAYQRSLVFSATVLGLLTMPYSPHGASLREGFKSVFRVMGLPWTPKRTLTIAVLLALFGGMLGLHHFYMGNRRRGWWYCACCLLAVPIVLGIVDAIALSRLDDAQFQERVGHRISA